MCLSRHREGAPEMERRLNEASSRETLRLELEGRELALLDMWRRKQPGTPTREEAVRRLLAEALGGDSLSGGYIETQDLSSANDG